MIQCTNCRQPYPDHGTPYRCAQCGGLYDYTAPFPYDPSRVDRYQPGIWRYRHTFGLPDAFEPVSLGEGGTPVVWAEAFGLPVAFKCEFQNPSGSFKDRGSAVIAGFLHGSHVKTIIEDSSGNAGSSLAAYAARAGMKARLFVPDSASGPKRLQIEAYGAEVVRIMGPRLNASKAAITALQSSSASGDSQPVYASHAYLPFNLPGYATLAYELVEQIGQAPGSLVLPAGQGGLLLGVWRGFQALQEAGVINKLPRLVGVQARACAPLWALYAYGPDGLRWAAEAPTLAEGIRVLQPLRGDAVLQAVSDSQGEMIAIDEEEILPGREQLARRGLYVEPTSAVVWGALAQLVGKLPEPIAAVLTGSGLKSLTPPIP
jgi:threonine synthase